MEVGERIRHIMINKDGDLNQKTKSIERSMLVSSGFFNTSHQNRMCSFCKKSAHYWFLLGFALGEKKYL